MRTPTKGRLAPTHHERVDVTLFEEALTEDRQCEASDPNGQCPNQASYLVKLTCPTAVKCTGTHWICNLHYDLLISGRLMCLFCDVPIDDWIVL